MLLKSLLYMILHWTVILYILYYILYENGAPGVNDMRNSPIITMIYNDMRNSPIITMIYNEVHQLKYLTYYTTNSDLRNTPWETT